MSIEKTIKTYSVLLSQFFTCARSLKCVVADLARLSNIVSALQEVELSLLLLTSYSTIPKCARSVIFLFLIPVLSIEENRLHLRNGTTSPIQSSASKSSNRPQCAFNGVVKRKGIMSLHGRLIEARNNPVHSGLEASRPSCAC